MVTTMAEGSISVNVGVLSSALAVAIQQAASSGQSQSPQVPANQSQHTSSQRYKCSVQTHESFRYRQHLIMHQPTII